MYLCSKFMTVKGVIVYRWCYAENAARETLEEVMAQALSKACYSRKAVRAVCLAVSGVNHPTDQQRILDWLRCV